MPKSGPQHQKMPISHGENRTRTPLEAKIMDENGMEQQMDQVYTQTQIKEAWEQYKTAYCWKYTKAGGEKVVKLTSPDMKAEKIWNCRMVKLDSEMGFPRYLEIEYGR